MKSLKGGYLFALMVTAAWSGPSWAQAKSDAPQPSPHADTADIVVTAQGRSQALRDVPVSVTITTGEQIKRDAVVNLESLSKTQPGFIVSKSPISDYIAIRGVSSSLNLGFEQSVGTFVDGVYRGRARAARAALFDVERVEVLKGPQPTFFGNNAIAGALSIATRKPGRTLSLNGDAYYVPEFGEYVVSAGVDLPASDSLSFRLAAQQSGGNGYIENSHLGSKGPDLRDQIGRVSVAWHPTSSVSVDARLDLGRNRDKNFFNIESLRCAPESVFGAPAGPCARYLAANGGTIDSKLDYRSVANRSFFNYDFAEGVVQVQLEAESFRVQSITGYFHHNYTLLSDPSPIPAEQGGSAVGTTQTAPGIGTERYRQISQELRFSTSADQSVSFLGGLYFQDGRLGITQSFGAYFARLGAATLGMLPANVPISYFIRGNERDDLFSGFISSTWRITNSLKINAGVRYSTVTKHASRSAQVGTNGSLPLEASFVPAPPAAQTILFPLTGVDPGNFASPSITDDGIQPTISFQYDVLPDIMLYGSYSRGFKAGAFSLGTANAILKPESVDAFEAGAKATLFNRKVFLALALFDSEYYNLQQTATVQVSTSVTKQIVGNVASSRAKGVELSASVKPISALTVAADVAYLDSRYNKFPNGPCTTTQSALNSACTQDLSGKRQAFAPQWSGNIRADLVKPLTDRLALRAGGSVFFSSSFNQQPTADPRLTQSGYAKFDARLGLESIDGHWGAAIVAKNITDRTTASYRQSAPGAPGTIAALADPPRTIGLQINFTY